MVDWIPPIPGHTHITGEPDTGKTTFAITVPGVLPQEVIFFDDDLKSRSLASTLQKSGHPFGFYVDLQGASRDAKATKPVDFWKFMKEQMAKAREAVPNAKVVVYDNFSPRMEDAIRAYSLTIMEELSSLTKGQQASMSMLTWPYTYQVYTQFLDDLQSLAPMVFTITHIKDQYIGQSKTGLKEARGQRPLIERPNFRVWTRHNGDTSDGGAPIGLVLKRIQALSLTPDGLVPVNVLPRKVKPLTWPKVIEYLQNPIGARAPTSDEIPNPLEESILSGELTPDQKDALRVARIAAEQEGFVPSMESETPSPEKVKAKEMKDRGMAPPQIAAEMGMPLPEVLKLLA